MKFSGTCIVCNDKIEINEIGLWSKGVGVKHEKCAQINELQCIVCGSSAGCLNVNFKIFVIFLMYLSYAYVRNAVMEKMPLIRIKNHLTKNFLFLTLNLSKFNIIC